MKKFYFYIILIFLAVSSGILFSQESENPLLKDIFSGISNYKNKEITLKLRFRNLDTIFDKIIFYDRKNYDIIFDTSEIKKTREFKKQAMNLHPGLEYLVTFKVRDVSDYYVSGDLIGFQAFIITRLPDIEQKKQKNTKKAE